MRDAPTPKSIEVLGAEVRDQLSAQRSYVEGLDTKAGVVLAFAGLLVAAAPENETPWIDAARLAGVVAAVVALLAFLPRGYRLVDLRTFQTTYAAAEPTVVRALLVEAYLNVLDETILVIDHKSRRLKGSIGALLLAIILAFVGLVT